MTSQTHARAVVITGASTGIGRACLAAAIAQGAQVFASVRKSADADSLRSDYGAAVTPIIFDVADEAGVEEGAREVAHALGDATLLGLVNNAGLAVPGPLLHLDVADLERQFAVNLFGVHRVTRAFAPLLGADRTRTGAPGRIVMMSSVGGRIANPFFGPYNASKFALEGYSTALRRELMIYGIDVIVVGPGAVATPIWDKNTRADDNPFKDTVYGEAVARMNAFALNLGHNGLPAEKVGALVWRCLVTPKPKTRYAISRNTLLSDMLPRLLPARLLDRIIARRIGLERT